MQENHALNAIGSPSRIVPLLSRLLLAPLLLLAGALRAPAQAPALGLHFGTDFSFGQHENFSGWLGRKVMYRVVFLDRSSWDMISRAEVVGVSKKWVESYPGRVEVISVPIFADGDPGYFWSITNGSRDSVFRSVANKIQWAGIADKVIIRLGWEANGDWYKWSYLHDPSGYRAAFRHIVSVMRSAAPKLRFEFNVSNLAYRGSSGAKWTEGYPGDDVVDIISNDIYDHWHSWNDMVYGDAGLAEVRSFAIAHNKPEAFTEWGLSTDSHGHGDNPGFVKSMISWMAARPGGVLYQAYWNTAGGPNALIYGLVPLLVPNASATYRDLLGPYSSAFSVSAGNTAPTISWIGDRVIDTNSSTGAINFTVGDAQTSASNLSVSVRTPDSSFLPPSRVVLGGWGGNRTVTATPYPNMTGWSTVWVKVSDGQLSKETKFVVQASAHLTFGDVGSPRIVGYTSWEGGYKLHAGGEDIYRNSDQFHFAHLTMNGDAEMTVRVSDLTNTHGWAKAGLMFRNHTGANSAYVGVFVTPSNGVVMQWRNKDGEYASTSSSMSGGAPRWVRLIRDGNDFYAYCSSNGWEWDFIKKVNVGLAWTARGGLALTSHNAYAMGAALFENFDID